MLRRIQAAISVAAAVDFNNPGFWERGRPSQWTPAPGDVDVDFLVIEANRDRELYAQAIEKGGFSLDHRLVLKRQFSQPISEPGKCLS